MDTPHSKEKKENSADCQELLEQEKQRSQDYLNRLRYLQADFENLRRRFDCQIDQIRNCAAENLVTKLLDVADELELAVKLAKKSDAEKNLVDGVQMTLKRLRKVLEEEGVSAIESTGKPFDPSKHHAVLVEERKDVENCVVLEEIRKGYVMNGKVIRPSMVKASTQPDSKSQCKEEE